MSRPFNFAYCEKIRALYPPEYYTLCKKILLQEEKNTGNRELVDVWDEHFKKKFGLVISNSSL